ncbi:Uncharacterised protein [Chryseobacterium nakagawai]|uniref:DUF4268 domain-containing protein n=1 Tax=Chryseobacterium nakagawai TaxID=1241982 RepID=A0AAD0YPI4_CHRNA|nr:hypothetical protein [Chryseobacterium nakagawai]AZA92755.1 hypothetical protein EG343_20255 [Chryseobacterium nakagawai]VEH19360.1 Uncharacterised protein [Chryseobacterium nakagawai]
MDYTFYTKQFHSVITEISKEKFEGLGLKVSIEVVLESVALKVYKPEWAADQKSPLDSAGRIFFSVWVNDKALQEEKLYYNIHALKLREFKNYKIANRDFAQDFRHEFSKYQKGWPNISLKYGPLTLMQGWVSFKPDNMQENIHELVQHFLNISFIIDEVLERYKK